MKLSDWFMEATDIRAVLRMRPVEVLEWAEVAWPGIIYLWKASVEIIFIGMLFRYLTEREEHRDQFQRQFQEFLYSDSIQYRNGCYQRGKCQPQCQNQFVCVCKSKASNLAPGCGNSVSCCQFESASESSSLSNSDTDSLFESSSVSSASTVEMGETSGKEKDPGLASFEGYRERNGEDSDGSTPEARPRVGDRQLPPSTLSYEHHLPDPGSGKAPVFDGKSAEDFIERFEGMCKRRGVRKWEDLCQYFPEYLDRPLRRWVKHMEASKEGDWGRVKEAFCERYRDVDPERQWYTRATLDTLRRARKISSEDVKQYVSDFVEVSDVLLSQGKMTEDLRCDMFITGLPGVLREQVYRVVGVELEDPGKGIFAKVSKAVLQEVRIQENAIRRERAMEVYPNEAVSWKPNENVPERPLNATQRANASGNVQDLSRELEQLKIHLLKQEEKQEEERRNNRELLQRLAAQGDARNNPYYDPARQPQYARGSLKCYHCGEPHMLNNCPDLKQRLRAGQIHQDAKGLYFLGPIGSHGPRVRFDRESPSVGILESAYKDWMQGAAQQTSVSYLQPQYPNEDVRESMPIRMLGVQSSLGSRPELNEEIDDEEDEFAGYVNSMNTRSQDDVRKRRRENGIASTRNREAGRYMGPSAQTEDDVMMERPHLYESQNSTQTQQPSLRDPGVTGRRNPRLQAARGPLKMNEDLMESLYERFHSRTLEIKVGELLRVAPQLKTKLFRELPEKPEGVVQALEVWQPAPDIEGKSEDLRLSERVPVELNHISNLQDERRSVPLNRPKKVPDIYALGLLYTHVYAGGVALKTLLDCGSGVDAMPYSVAKELGLRIRPDPKVKMVPIGGAELICYGVAEGVAISIGDITLTINAFVLEMCPTDLLLGRPFMDASMMALIQQRGGHVECTIYNAARTRRCTFNVFRPSEKKITREDRLWEQGEDSGN